MELHLYSTIRLPNLHMYNFKFYLLRYRSLYLTMRKILGYHGGDYEGYCLLWCEAVSSGINLSMFIRNLLSLNSVLYHYDKKCNRLLYRDIYQTKRRQIPVKNKSSYLISIQVSIKPNAFIFHLIIYAKFLRLYLMAWSFLGSRRSTVPDQDLPCFIWRSDLKPWHTTSDLWGMTAHIEIKKL